MQMSCDMLSQRTKQFAPQVVWVSGHAKPPPAGACAVRYPTPKVVWTSNMAMQMATTAAVLSAEAAAIEDVCLDEDEASYKG